ncbi:hypothetical protein CDAR_580611 [Caerostris darwini]|uniref:Uncharacterized protein n=1 Tax=Caerostris darwini TaxID=1538125 RepID=A0AAV4R7J5_9ARAC|nr:hypothetical protein CDAR_580611 [Caerostris darwini]
MLTEPPLLSDADHCTAITAARAQLKDKEKAVDLIQQILQNQNILIDGGVIQRTALKPTMDGLKTAEAALAEATKREGRTPKKKPLSAAVVHRGTKSALQLKSGLSKRLNGGAPRLKTAGVRAPRSQVPLCVGEGIINSRPEKLGGVGEADAPNVLLWKLPFVDRAWMGERPQSVHRLERRR